DLIRLQTAGLAAPWHKVIARNLDLFFLGVTGQFDDFHAIAERRWNGVEHIRRSDEKDAREIECNVEVMIAEGRVLFRIENFEQRRRRIAAKVRAELIDFVEHENRIARASAPDVLNHLSGERADVRSPVAADLGLVAHAAERNADELAP